MILVEELVLAGRRLRARIQRQIELCRRPSMTQFGGAESSDPRHNNLCELHWQVNGFQKLMPTSVKGVGLVHGVIGLSIIGCYIVAIMPS